MLKKMMLKKAWLSNKVANFVASERGDVNVVSIVVLIGIAIILAFAFRKGISAILETLINTIRGNATKTISMAT